MNIRTIFLFIVISLSPAMAIAGTGHSHEPVNQQKAEQVATRIVASLVNQGVIPESWGTITVKNSEQKVFGGQTEWVVSYRNDTVSDPAKRTLYIFLTLTGDYIAANYTGE